MQHQPWPHVSRRALITGTLSALALTATGCTAKQPVGPSPTPSASPSATPPRVLRLASAADPLGFDPALVGDTDSFRITRQVYETLISIDTSTGGPVAGLAESWTESEDGLRYTFILREGVQFHDGEPLTAKAVVANFERWQKMNAEQRAGSVQGFDDVFHVSARLPSLPSAKDIEADFDKSGNLTEAEKAKLQQRLDQLKSIEAAFKHNLFTGSGDKKSASYFESVKATGDREVTLTLRRRLPSLIEALTLPGMAIASPKALKSTGTKALSAVPVGTGPYRLSSFSEGVVSLELNKDYWNTARVGANPQHPERVEVVSIPSPHNRLNALLAEEVDGFDMVSVDVLRTLVRQAKVVVQRDPFSVLYLGMNHKHKWLGKPAFRHAIAHALNKGQLAEKLFISGTKQAHTILPPTLSIPDPDEVLGHDEAKAKELLSELKYDGEPIEFAYPLRVARTSLPLPERTFAFIAEDLAKVGIVIKPRPIAWSDDYLGTVRSEKFTGLHLLGFSGGYRSPDDFISSILAQKKYEFGYTSALLDAQILLARSLPQGEERTTAYQQIVNTLNQDLPLIPLVYPISALAFNPSVSYYPSSPVLNEVFVDTQVQVAAPSNG
ncbi:ABC transporter substrate-binding protein [Glutamicibacter endophyticus]